MVASKRDEIVEKALEIFYRGGFHATGMDTLVKETGISKTSMYKHFRSKEDLIVATLQLRDLQFRENFVRRVEELATEPLDRLHACFQALDDWFHDPKFRSCMFIKASSEYQDPAHPIHATSADHKRLMQSYMEDLAREAGLRDPKALASQLILVMEGGIVMAHLVGADRVGQDGKEAAKALIDAASR